MDIVEAIAKVLAVGLLLGAGLPALFAVGLRWYADGSGTVHDDGTVSAPNPILKYLGIVLFAIVALVIVTGILWITRGTINYYFHVKIFPFG
ncbi:hypothetical protein HH308_22225 [Gordonia sp. TBRC 11910]|uniref:Uncharacterized protein n=1 Tax=Gordonia asplenii TaxID=2725283 RepID=A0A848L4G2_9ACTN|nr:hypothetical protein [Gordonia asplenii]NMO03935.1 hypothetical protein [Gordonia asplenii]